MTTIEWTRGDDGAPGKTWNPTTGCDRISPGCDNCYALTLAKRLKAMGSAKYQNDGDPRTSGPGFGLTVHPDALDAPLHWRKPTRVFINSMSDLFHARVPVSFIAEVWAVMARTPQHTYQCLTKRTKRMEHITASLPVLPNVWLGTSVESWEYDWRIGHLAATQAAIRFLSLEPLIARPGVMDLSGIHWAIIGGESGGGARPMSLGWVRDIIAQCRDAGTAVFVKQLGSCWAAENGGHGKGGDWDIWPADLRIREFPVAADLTGAA